MRIAIVDDELPERELIFSHVEKFLAENVVLPEEQVSFVQFENGEDFLSKFHPGEYDIVLLDIYMREINGMEVARKIVSKDNQCQIIFITSSSDFGIAGYEVHAAGYITKPVTDHLETLYNSLNYVLMKMQMDRAGCDIQTDYGDVFIYFRNVQYVDCFKRAVNIHLNRNTVKAVGNYAYYLDVFSEDKRFLECYRNIIVNMDFIDHPDENDFVLKSGTRLPISRRKKTEVINHYIRYFMAKSGSV